MRAAGRPVVFLDDRRGVHAAGPVGGGRCHGLGSEQVRTRLADGPHASVRRVEVAARSGGTVYPEALYA